MSAAFGSPAAVIGSPYLVGRDRYERSIEAWTDNTHSDAFTHTVRLADDDLTVEVWAVCTASPGYDVREAGARLLGDGADPAPAAGFARIAGTRMVAGFTRRVQEAVGAGPGADRLVDAAVEIARLARQVARLPASATEGLDTREARQCWHLDTTGWVDLPNSCFTYSPAGRALLDRRPVTTPMVRELYTPPPGARKLFRRRKLLRLVRTGPRLDLFHAMHDNVHGFDLHYEVDLPTGRIVAAHSVTSRLPYRGVCDEPQARIQALVGETLDAGLRKRMQRAVGGETGCAQVYDLTADLLKLLTLA